MKKYRINKLVVLRLFNCRQKQFNFISNKRNRMHLTLVSPGKSLYIYIYIYIQGAGETYDDGNGGDGGEKNIHILNKNKNYILNI